MRSLRATVAALSSRPARAIASLLLLGVLTGLGRDARADEVALEGAVVRWDPGLADLGRRAVEVLPGVREAVAHRLGWPYEGPPVSLVLVEGLPRMRAEARGRVPAWAVGAAVWTRATLVIRRDLLAAGYGGGLVPVLRHEWVHLSWGRRAGPNRRRLPLWVEEGLAEEIGGGISVDAGAALDLAATFRRLHDFASLRDRFPEDARDADLAYQQSRSWVRYFAGEVGWDVVRLVLDDLARGAGGTEEAAFAEVVLTRTGRSLDAWHAAWRLALEEQATPWFHLLLRDFHGLIFAVLGLLGAGAYTFVRRRRRRLIAALPDVADDVVEASAAPVGRDGP